MKNNKEDKKGFRNESNITKSMDELIMKVIGRLKSKREPEQMKIINLML